MKTNVILSILHLFVLLVIFGCGLFFLTFPWAPAFTSYIAHILLSEPEVFFSLGIILLGIGFLFFLGFYAQHQYRFLSIEMGKGSLCEVDPAIIEKYLQKYWKHAYPSKEIRSSVRVLPDKTLEILVSFSSSSEWEKDLFFEKVEIEIGALLEEKFGYKKKFLFTALI